ncbi:DUF2147 domain-containing protein [Rhodopseudomonas boonkerdii]|uniref:DUF2147 domain-containing protein n=1 Tax=Rhodopseudomonas boonkerdii TaxID=475937 RepID=UPI001E3BA440|nr:DUF2147 domain-containing protein [Rhodopseudomonas boonkerdii]UGV26941.1 DUF2147 domain-containing protein [Rhodopseudomonas boonkerdii]
MSFRTCLTMSLLFVIPASFAGAGDVRGDWLVEGGSAKVRIAECDGRVWGALAWEKKSGGTDEHNPDASKRSRPTLGIVLLSDMKPDGKNGWAGKIYNAENGKSYTSTIKAGDTTDKLALKGCVMGVLCGGQTWTRSASPYTPPVASTKSSTKSAPPATSPGLQPDIGDVCMLPEVVNSSPKGQRG